MPGDDPGQVVGVDGLTFTNSTASSPAVKNLSFNISRGELARAAHPATGDRLGRYVLPAVVFGNLVAVNFYFMAGLVLLEKWEGTLEAQVVTPLADWEYLVSKTVTLAALSLVEQFVIVGSAYGLGFGVGALIGGVALAAILYTLRD